jgi:hypothetical protein
LLVGCSVGVGVGRVRPRGRGRPAATSPATADSLRPEERAARRRWVKASCSSRRSGDIELLGRAVGVADRQLIGLASGDLGLVEVRNRLCCVGRELVRALTLRP